MMAEVGFNKYVAVLAVAALTEEVNEKFGDNISKTATLAGLKKFFASGVELNCRSCGWRKSGTKFCTQRCSDTSDGDSCKEFRHVFAVEAN